MEEKLAQYKNDINALAAEDRLSPDVHALLEALMTDLTEAVRSNNALRRAAVKSAQTSMMSSRLRDALQE